MFVEDSRGSVTGNIFQYVANGLDVHRGSAPRMLANTYTRLAVPGLTGCLSFDIQRLHSGRLEEMAAAEVISFSCDTEEAVAAAALSRRQATQVNIVCRSSLGFLCFTLNKMLNLMPGAGEAVPVLRRGAAARGGLCQLRQHRLLQRGLQGPGQAAPQDLLWHQPQGHVLATQQKHSTKCILACQINC